MRASLAKLISLSIIGGFLSSAALADPVLTIDTTQSIAHFAPTFSGLMTEEINHSYDGGLYAELIQNRSFKDDAKQPIHWAMVQDGSAGSIALDDAQPIAKTAQTVCLKVNLTGAAEGHRVGVANDGYWGIPVKPSTTYRASFYARGDVVPLTASIESNDGKTVFATAEVPAITGDWQKYTITLSTKADATPGTANRFVISSQKPGTIWLNLVSLFPPTWHDRPNGNRIDLMQWMNDLNPSFLRCPGGNYLEGNTVETRFNWENTIGDISQRPGHMGCWGYRSSEGLGLLEFLQWAEDVKAEPVLAVYAGYSLPTKAMKDGTAIKSGADLEPYVQQAVDEIDYATGDANTKWGARRAADGHPAPFPLHYVEIGNEDFMKLAAATYEARYAQFFDALKARYPKLQFIATIPVKGRSPDVIDDHYYKTSDEMARLAHQYDKHNRNGPKVFVGEWATREITKTNPNGSKKYVMMPWGYKGDQTPAMHAALGDAAFLTGLERNADIVVMNCYAPLLVNVNRNGGFQWCPNLIGYDALTSYASPSYYVQQMFNQNRGDTVVKATIADEPKDFFYSATRDAKNVYIKAVNRSASSTSMKIHLDGVKIDPANAKSTVLAVANVDDLNTLAEPKKVLPVTAPLADASGDFSFSFAANSVTVLALPLQ